VQDLTTWAQEYYRVLKPGTTGFMFVGEPYITLAQALFAQAGFEIKGTFYWCRTNPGPSVTKADFMPAIDLAIQFVKPGATRTFHYPGDEDGEGFNWHCFPICGGKERLVNAKKETLHPTQKPEAVIQHLMELITVPGDMVLDGFMGVGTTPAVAKRLGRKCIGIEADAVYFAAAQHRVEA
jgi:DNA modification methylase